MKILSFQSGPEGSEKEVIIKVPPENKRIGVLFSGGIDSTILLYLLAKYCPDREITALTLQKQQSEYTFHAQSVIEQIGLPNIKHHSEPFERKDEKGTYKPYVNYFLINGTVDYVYSATNCLPPEGTIPEDGSAPPRMGANYREEVLGTPFLNLYKYYTLDLYFREQVEHLLGFTHSCITQSTGECGHCWWCKEKQWAFSQLNRPLIKSA